MRNKRQLPGPRLKLRLNYQFDQYDKKLYTNYTKQKIV